MGIWFCYPFGNLYTNLVTLLVGLKSAIHLPESDGEKEKENGWSTEACATSTRLIRYHDRLKHHPNSLCIGPCSINAHQDRSPRTLDRLTSVYLRDGPRLAYRTIQHVTPHLKICVRERLLRLGRATKSHAILGPPVSP